MISIFRKLLKDESGPTAIEYGLIAALISVAAIVAMQSVGDSLNLTFGAASTAMTAAAG